MARQSQNVSFFDEDNGLLTVIVRMRLYSIMTALSIICYMYYIYGLSTFHGLLYDGSSSHRQNPVAGSPASSIVATATTGVDSSAPTQNPAPGYWLANMQRQGKAPFHANKEYQVFRNVCDFGAIGDNVHDDTAAINEAISSGSRCGRGCDSSTVSPALVYFPPGRYKVSAPIVAMYYTQLVGDPLDLPVLVAAKDFNGIAVIDTDPYEAYGENWYQNQNNFFRGIRNFVIDLREMDKESGTGIHHQVAQATSIYNVVFQMRSEQGTKQRGIFMDNGSGGFLSSLTFIGGDIGAYFGNQQFTTLDLSFHSCKTAIYLNWDWVWLLKSIKVDNCSIGLDITSGQPDKMGVGSVVLLDSYIKDTETAVLTAKSAETKPVAGGTLLIQNLVISGVKTAVVGAGGKEMFGGSEGTANTTIPFWGHGKGYSKKYKSGDDVNVVADDTRDFIPKVLKDSSGRILERPRPQYRNIPSHRFVSVKEHGVIGDGIHDETKSLQRIFDTHGKNVEGEEKKIIFFDHGVYRITDTLYIPPNTYITGEAWPTIMLSGPKFANPSDPNVGVMVGRPGEEGIVEISDVVFDTQGPKAGGAILMEWNIRSPQGQNVSGMWDVHFRIGGSHSTELQSYTCKKRPDITEKPVLDGPCMAAFMLLHIGKTASLMMENMWLWTSDHDLDAQDHEQITIYSGRGLYCEAEDGPVWMYGTAVEHNTLYNYQLVNTRNIFMGVIQTETPYFQTNPNSLEPFPALSEWHDPDFKTQCAKSDSKLCEKSWGVRILNSTDIFIFGAGLYSFFENYSTDCIKSKACQSTMVLVKNIEAGTKDQSKNIWILALNTIGTENMLRYIDEESKSLEVKALDGNVNGFADTVGLIML